MLRGLGVAAVFTPKDFAITEIMGEFVQVIRAARGLDAVALRPRAVGEHHRPRRGGRAVDQPQPPDLLGVPEQLPAAADHER